MAPIPMALAKMCERILIPECGKNALVFPFGFQTTNSTAFMTSFVIRFVA